MAHLFFEQDFLIRSRCTWFVIIWPWAPDWQTRVGREYKHNSRVTLFFIRQGLMKANVLLLRCTAITLQKRQAIGFPLFLPNFLKYNMSILVIKAPNHRPGSPAQKDVSRDTND